MPAKTNVSTPYGGPSFQHVAQLSARVAEHSSTAAAAQAQLDDLRNRREALSARLVDLNARQPVIGDGIDASLVEALVADPSAQPDPASVASSADDHLSAMTRWEADKAILTQAIARIEADLEAAEKAASAQSGPGGAAFREFVEAAHEALMTTFLREFERLKVDYLQPLRLLEALDEQGRIADGTMGHDRIIGYTHLRFGTDSTIETEQHQSRGRSITRHLHAGPLTPDERQKGEERLGAFRQALADLIPVSGRRAG